MRLTLRQLEVFLTVAQAPSMTQAAERLYMTKSAVSQALAELERQLNRPLFDRHHGRLQLNQWGTRLIPLADELRVRVDDIVLTLADQPVAPALTLGASHTIGGYLLPPLLAAFKAQHGWVPKVVIANSHHLEQQLLRFECDLAMIEGHIVHPELVITPWRQETLAVLGAQDHPLCQALTEGILPWKALDDVAWILREPGSGTRAQFDQLVAPQLSHSPRILLEMASFEAILSTVAQGLGVTFGSVALTHYSGFGRSIVPLNLPSALRRQLSLCYSRHKYQSEAARQWIDFMIAQP